MRARDRPARPVLETGRMTYVADLLATVSRRSRELIGWKPAEFQPRTAADILTLARALLSRRGEASGTALARDILAGYARLDAAGRLAVLTELATGFGADKARLDAAITAYQADPTGAAALALHEAAEPRRQELIRRRWCACATISSTMSATIPISSFSTPTSSTSCRPGSTADSSS
jgi:hypothetical protein